MYKRFFLISSLLCTFLSHAQDDLLKEIDSTQVVNKEVSATFKGLQIVTMQSTKLPSEGEYYMVVSHRFGSVKGSWNEFFGFDSATTKIGGLYGVKQWLSVGVSRHTLFKLYEASAKYRLFKQTDTFPFEIVGYNVVGINSGLKKQNYPKIQFNDRLSYTNQLLIARKFSENLSLELAPTYIHKNLFEQTNENNAQWVFASGGRMKLSKRLSLNMEYGYNFNKPGFYKNPLSVGLDIDTGGHIFQLLFTNSQSMGEANYFTNASGNWGKGDFFFGFNMYRVF